LFQGGQTFSDAVLAPTCSGASGSPIIYGAYGSGRPILQAVYLPGAQHDLTFDNLELTSNNQLFLSCGGCGQAHYNITLKNSYLHNTTGLGVHSEQADHDWLIENNVIEHTGDSGLLIEYSSNVTITGNTVLHTGEQFGPIPYGTHGIYAKGPNLTISYNDFSYDTGGQAISVRAHGQHIYGNTIHDTPSAFEFFDYDTAAPPQGTSYIYNNRAWNIGDDAFYYGNQADPQGKTPSVSIVLASNTFALASSGTAVNLSSVPSTASVTVVNNIFSGSYGSAYQSCATCTEHNNNWWNGAPASPGGSGDMSINPNLSAPPAVPSILGSNNVGGLGAGLALPSGSTLINKGTTNVPGLTYTQGTGGQPLQYSGSAPDIGAVEFN
jgi:parallel beta-helix repeat protein